MLGRDGATKPRDIGQRREPPIAAACQRNEAHGDEGAVEAASGTTSETVPSATRSSHCIRSGSGRAAEYQPRRAELAVDGDDGEERHADGRRGARGRTGRPAGWG